MKKKLLYTFLLSVFAVLLVSGCVQRGVDPAASGQGFQPPSQEGEAPGEGLVPPFNESEGSVEKVISGPSPSGPADLDPRGWVPFIDDDWSFQLLVPTDWVSEEIDLDNPYGPTFEFWKREVMLMPESMAKTIAERSGPPGPDDPPTYPSIILDVTLGSMEEYRILHVEPTSSETIEINGLLVDLEDRYGQYCYVFRSPSNPDLIVTLTDSINGFPQRMEGNEDLLAQIDMVIASFQYTGDQAHISLAVDTDSSVEEDVQDEQEEAPEIESVESAPPALVEEQGDQYAPLEKAFYQDDFSNEDWYVKKHTDYGFYYASGGYRIYNNIYGGVIWSIRKLEHWSVVVQAQAAQIDGPGNGYYGVVCRYKDEDNYYALVVGENGFFGIVRRLKGEHSFLRKGYLEESRLVELLEASGRRVITGECIEDNLALYLNGEKLAEVKDGSFESGYFGAAVGTTTHPGVEVEFTRFEAAKP